jgi:hypothetical protein
MILTGSLLKASRFFLIYFLRDNDMNKWKKIVLCALSCMMLGACGTEKETRRLFYLKKK